jgi:putative ABC transport system permease protein
VTGSSIRALARVARRDIARHRGRSLLVVLLVALPVAAMVAGISLYRTTTPTAERNDVAQMGQADLIAFKTTRSGVVASLPAGSVVEPLIYQEGRLQLPGARRSVSLRAVDLDGVGRGMLTVVDGRVPKGPEEAAITAPVAGLAGVAIGGTIDIDDGPSLTIVGIVENPMNLGDAVVLLDPAGLAFDEESATWLVRLPSGVDPEAVVQASIDPDTGEQQVLLQARQSRRLEQYGGDSASPTILVLGSLALVESALIASAAFAVSIRRRQRELGLLAATGATPRQLGGTVVAQGLILGCIACLVGIAIGLGGAIALSPWLDQLTQHRNPPLVVDIGGLVGPVTVGFLAAMIAAIIPARTVSRVPVLLALSGRRPAQSPARRTLWFGVLAIGLSALMTIVGATTRFGEIEALRLPLLIGGAVLSTLGFGACGPWLLERLEGLASRLPVAGRIAFRDTARARSRTSPIVTAILAGCAAAVALGAFQATRDEESTRGWTPSLYADQLAFNGEGATDAGELLRGEAGVIEGTSIPYLAPKESDVYVAFRLPDARGDDGKVINLVEQCQNCYSDVFAPYEVYRPAAATPEIVAARGGVSVSADLAAGRAVVFTARAASATKLEIVIQNDPEDPASAETLTMPVRLIRVPVPGGTLPDLFLPDATIAHLGLVPPDEDAPYELPPYVVRYDHPVTDQDLAHAQEVASRFPDTVALIDTPPTRQGGEFRLVIMGLVLLFAVSVTGIAIALGEAESRPEQRSLLAIGADPRLRRRIAAARAAVLALMAGILAVPAGLLPIWGVFASRGSPLAVPTIEIVGAVLALPVLAVASSWLLSRPIPDWSAFRGVGARE